jgi:hypothetical protein
MKRIILIASTAATFVAVALAPAVASADGHHHHRHHHRGAHARLRSFGTGSPTAPTSDNAGTVTSFTGGVLTIKLTDGNSVTGKVTTTTELKCETTPVSSMARVADHGGSDGGPSDKSNSSGNDRSDDNDDHDDEPQPPVGEHPAEGEDNQDEACEMTFLKEGVAVRNAELSVTSTGATFLEVKIIRSR